MQRTQSTSALKSFRRLNKPHTEIKNIPDLKNMRGVHFMKIDLSTNEKDILRKNP